MNPRGFEHLLTICLGAAFALATIGVIALVAIRLLSHIAGAL